MFGLLAAGLVLWAGCLAALILRTLVGVRVGQSGGPPNYILPSLMLGAFGGMLAASYISRLTRRWSDGGYLVLGLGVMVSALIPVAIVGSMPFG